jgi:hypothetical protein
VHHAASSRASADFVGPLLSLGVAIPVLYFAVQIAAAPFYPGYSFFSRDASTLGSAGSTAPWIFNLGALALGMFQAGTAGAFAIALPRAGIGRALSTLTVIALLSSSLGSLNAFLHPLPDPRHSGGWLAMLGSGTALLPPLSAMVLWRLRRRRSALVIVVACLTLVPLMTGLPQRLCIHAGLECEGYQFFLNSYPGLIQRCGAALLFVPIAVIAYSLRHDSPEVRL